MTVNSTAATISYNGAGSPGPFAIPFYFLADSHIVAVKTVDTVETTLVLDTDYTLTGAGDMSGGSLTLDVDLESGETLDITLSVPYDQQQGWQRNDPLTAANIERGFDKLTMIAKQLRDIFAILRGDFDAVNLTTINASIATLTSDLDAAEADIATLQSDLTALESALNAELAAVGVVDLAGWWDQWAENGSLATPEGMVLYFSKTSSPTDDGEVYADYMPKPRTYNPSAMQATFPPSYAIPSTNIHNGAGTLAVNVNIDDWPIGVVHDFWQIGNGRITVEIGSGSTSAASVYLDAYTADRTHISTYNGVYTPSIRSSGVGSRFSIVRCSTYIFMAVGSVEDVP